MNKYYFLRTDRIGDFLMSSILINAIKKNTHDSYIIVIASSKNYDYIKQLNFIDEVILYPENNLIKKILLFKRIFLDDIFSFVVLDGKKRSMYMSFFSGAKEKYLFTTKKFYYDVLKIFYSTIFLDSNEESKISEIKKFLNIKKIKFSDNLLNVLKNRTFKKEITNRLLIPNKNNILLHFDEKWLDGSYINSYKSIEPDDQSFEKFTHMIVDKSEKNLIISTGSIQNKIIHNYKSTMMMVDDFYYKKKYKDKNIILFDNLSFLQLEYLISKSDLIISCHGAVTHLASSWDKPLIDIIELNKEKFYKKWSNHIRGYKSLYRDDFEKLSNNIINKL